MIHRKRLLVKFDTEKMSDIAIRLGIHSFEIPEWISGRYEDILDTLSGLQHDDHSIVIDKDQIGKITIGGYEYEVEYIDAIGIECPGCGACIYPIKKIQT